ncbi:PREDICTED: probable terpene synthase 9 [Theobroma cacao]|uniref:(+)-delta-cadinene synthase n=1 Tax=Theobroma cacao TaxID=3641 RepID=A0AB32WNH9_THECC|nr:PREDICTED: probable terpene synthase 9 [Theobroma cacao]
MNSSTGQGNVPRRRNADHVPSIWDPQFIMSLTAPYTYEDEHAARLEVLKEDAKSLIAATSMEDPRDLLKLIDTIQRLGVAYHFEKEIKVALHLVHAYIPTDLYHTALQFRLLRGNGFSISSDVFNKFTDKDGKFMDNLREDVAGLLSLFEAAHLGIPGEDVLEEAKSFSRNHLNLLTGKLESNIAEQVRQSLDVPLHRRMVRSEARNFIEAYQRDSAKSSVLLELAKLDYNVLQATYLKELKELAEWWEDINFKEKLPFGRDRLIECHIVAVGSISNPQFSQGRKNAAKFCAIGTYVDDVYDNYGSIDELEKFIEALDRWDIKVMEELPEYMKVCYLALYNSVDEVVQDASKHLDLDVLPYVKDTWIAYCKGMLKEAQWNQSGYMPTFDEYLKNAWISIGALVLLTISYFGISESITEYLPHCIENWSTSELFYQTCLISRLVDDLMTSKAEMERGETVNSIRCYMIQHDVSEEEAQDDMEGLISYSWKKLNEMVVHNSYPLPMVKLAMDTAQCVHRIYKYGDFFATQTTQAKIDCVRKLLFESIPME